MSEHYFTPETSKNSHEIKHVEHVMNQPLVLWTDHGVFSKTGLDFGSRTLIESVSQLSLVAGPILDVGCGYGPIGICMAKLFQRTTLMVDINERAVALANRNILDNQINQYASAIVSNLYEHVIQTDYALIVSNPPIRAGKQVVHTIIADSYHHLINGGKLIIVIQKKQGAPSAEKKMAEVFNNVTLLNRHKGYWILMSEK